MRRIIAEHIQPACIMLSISVSFRTVVLSVTRLCLRRGNVEVSIVDHRKSKLDAVHQACIKIDKIEFVIPAITIGIISGNGIVRERVYYVTKRHDRLSGTIVIMLIGAESALWTAAVIPKDEVIFLRRILFCTEINERFQCLRNRHLLGLALYCCAVISGDAVTIQQHQFTGIRIRIAVFIDRVDASRLPDLIVNAADHAVFRKHLRICIVIRIPLQTGIIRHIHTIRKSQIIVFIVLNIIVIKLPPVRSTCHYDELYIIIGTES